MPAKKAFADATQAKPAEGKPAAPKVVDVSEAPAAPTGQQQQPPGTGGVPAFSNDLLFELD